MDDNQITAALQTAVLPIMRSLPRDQHGEFAEQLLALGWELTRGIHGNAFMHGWLDGARHDLRANPNTFVRLREPS